MQAMKARYEKKLAEAQKVIEKQRKDIEERDDLIDKGKDMLFNKSEQISQLKRMLEAGKDQYDMMVEQYEQQVNDLVGALKREREKNAALQAEIDRLKELFNNFEYGAEQKAQDLTNKNEQIDQLKRHIGAAGDERNTVVGDMNDKLRRATRPCRR
eukprot:TRINITY_DN513_c0_g1_i1.p2 TRINITY_DN513_c0_g1~~TRINITY_DN513_c0_g1_i1.p2  ORF type:complete len:156 (-),score=60.89 TRINITY_DN513_c0_g1_i1:356-823(-)